METELLFELTFEIDRMMALNGTPEGDRVIVYAKGGKVDGPRLKGEVLPGSGDWFLIRPDGVGVVDVRAVLRTGDGELIYMTYRGIAKLPPGGLAAGGAFPIRSAPTFMVPRASKYAWLNTVQAVGVGGLDSGGVRYRVYEVK